MKRRELLAALGAQAARLALFRERAAAAAGPNIKWAVSMFLWTSTQWPDRAPVPFTDMLDVIKDTGFDGFRFVGWPDSLRKYDLSLAFLDRELSKRGVRIATLSGRSGWKRSVPSDPVTTAHERLLNLIAALDVETIAPSMRTWSFIYAKKSFSSSTGHGGSGASFFRTASWLGARSLARSI